jgi:hypothetical protein
MRTKIEHLTFMTSCKFSLSQNGATMRISMIEQSEVFKAGCKWQR